MSYHIPRRLSRPEHRAIKHLLERSALADCPGTGRSFTLTPDGDLVIRDVDQWRWSHGEAELIAAIRFILGEGRYPELRHLDDTNRLVVREALRQLAEDEARAENRLLHAVESTPTPLPGEVQSIRRWNA